jgi:hypothetical protein
MTLHLSTRAAASAASAVAAVAAVAALAITPLQAFAASSSSATLGPLIVTLYDLVPGDDISPSITFDTGYYDGSAVRTSVEDSYLDAYDTNGRRGLTGFSPVSSTSMLSTVWATSRLSGPGQAASTSLLAMGSALGTSGPGFGRALYSAEASAHNGYDNTFILSAGTAVVISATTTLQASVTNTFDPFLSNGEESASARTGFSISGIGPSGSGLQSADDSRSIFISSEYVDEPDCGFSFCYGPNSGSASGTMAVSFVNASGGDLSGAFSARASVSGYSYAQAVPEPGTWALWMAGLLSIGTLVRRRAG